MTMKRKKIVGKFSEQHQALFGRQDLRKAGHDTRYVYSEVQGGVGQAQIPSRV